MASIQKQGTRLPGSTLTENKNLLSPLGFRFLLSRAPNVEYFCQAAGLPGMALGEANQHNPFVTIPHPGDHLTFDPFTIRFMIDEDMKNFNEIYDWMLGLGYPDQHSQYKSLYDSSAVFSDGSIMVLTSHNNASIRIVIEDMFPVALSPVNFDSRDTEVTYLEADVTFRYRKYRIERL